MEEIFWSRQRQDRVRMEVFALCYPPTKNRWLVRGLWGQGLPYSTHIHHLSLRQQPCPALTQLSLLNNFLITVTTS